jgi:hypothetical protein
MIDAPDAAGLVGVSMSIYCYARVQWHRDYAKRLDYSALNFFSSMLLFISLLHHWNLAAFVSNAAWCLISLYGVRRCLKYMRRNKQRL